MADEMGYCYIDFEPGVYGFVIWREDDHGYEENLISVFVNEYEIEMPRRVAWINIAGVSDEKVYKWAKKHSDELRREVMALPYIYME